MSNALEVAAALGAAFPNENTVAEIQEDVFRDQLAPLEALSWPGFEVAMVGTSPSVRIEFEGLDGLIAAWQDWLTPFDAYRIEVESFEDAGDRALIFVRQFARPHGTESEIENASAAVVWTREGKLTRVEFHMNRDEARRVAGLD